MFGPAWEIFNMFDPNWKSWDISKKFVLIEFKMLVQIEIYVSQTDLERDIILQIINGN